ncbi:hypothetical protein B9479_006412 [Cryptococcus floricola]|uniref:Translocation protein SEC62 n=1 Tax=Cryptococcus floricola TaxID=2591691 RepID=A0A5D3ASF3_9TREE|nr:hypothetical protein B9479_006412 [Cryptococcus floricola]
MVAPSDATSVKDAQKRAEPELKNVVDFLRAKAGPKVRMGILNGKRVEYFKGKTAVRCLLSPQYQKLKKVPAITTEDEAKALLARVLPFAFFLRTDRPPPEALPPPGQPKPLRLAPQQSFDPASYYTWFYDGSPLYTYLGGAAMVFIMLAGVMFPLWPVTLRIGVWYLSVGVLCLVGLFIVMAIVRLIFWCLTVMVCQRAIWIFPNLFEDVGFVDSFIPGWEYDIPKTKLSKRPKTSKSSSRVKTLKPVLAPGDNPGTSSTSAPASPASSANDPVASAGGVGPAAEKDGLKSRRAFVEEAEDDE